MVQHSKLLFTRIPSKSKNYSVIYFSPAFTFFFYRAALFSFAILVNIIVLYDYKAFCKRLLDGTSEIKSTATAERDAITAIWHLNQSFTLFLKDCI